MQGDSESQIQRLDAVCMHAIFAFLPAESLACAACVSRGWRDVAADDVLWQLAYSQLDGEDYRRNSAAQLTEVAAGLPPSHSPPPSHPTLPHINPAIQHPIQISILPPDLVWHCRSAGRMEASLQLEVASCATRQMPPLCRSRGCASSQLTVSC